MYVILESGGKQYKASVGDSLLLEKIDKKVGDSILFEKILLLVNDDTLILGTPYIENIKVTGKILSQTKGEKIRVSKYKAKVRYRRTTGHRQLLTNVSIDKIHLPKTPKHK
ncbi:50S ribosomal protein L21 [Candidatus Gottesmanbacteria bacterium]|nr:50S ribosomal protein L21 [Candidatus Gottesmanbacteria bacterium]